MYLSVPAQPENVPVITGPVGCIVSPHASTTTGIAIFGLGLSISKQYLKDVFGKYRENKLKERKNIAKVIENCLSYISLRERQITRLHNQSIK